MPRNPFIHDDLPPFTDPVPEPFIGLTPGGELVPDAGPVGFVPDPPGIISLPSLPDFLTDPPAPALDALPFVLPILPVIVPEEEPTPFNAQAQYAGRRRFHGAISYPLDVQLAANRKRKRK